MLGFIVLFLSLSFSYVAGQDCESLGVLFYEDIGCKPVKVEGKPCPVEFKCDDLTLKKDTCLFQSKVYNAGETVDNALTEHLCRVNCNCNAEQDRAGKGLFTCHQPDCPEWGAEISGLKKEGCYHAHAYGQCCSYATKCKSDPDVVTCQGKNGRTIYEGELIDTLDCGSCSECFCVKGPGGKGEPSCKRIPCLIQITESQKLAENCAPVYYSRRCANLCCPDTFACPKDTDVIKRITDVKDSGLQCKFGQRTLKLGEGLDTTADYHGPVKVTCECILPPFLTCRKTIS